MERDSIIALMLNNPGIKITHSLFSPDEFIYAKLDGRIYDEDENLFEDWYSDECYKHNGIRRRSGTEWRNQWNIVYDKDTCALLSKTFSGKSFLYSNRCKTCQYLHECKYR